MKRLLDALDLIACFFKPVLVLSLMFLYGLQAAPVYIHYGVHH